MAPALSFAELMRRLEAGDQDAATEVFWLCPLSRIKDRLQGLCAADA